MVSKQDLNKCFLFSQMTIINEMMSYENYYQLRFVEFLEMFCRAALKASGLRMKGHRPISKVRALLEIILGRLKKNKVRAFKDLEIIEIDRERRPGIDMQQHVGDLCDHDVESASHEEHDESLATESGLETDEI